MTGGEGIYVYFQLVSSLYRFNLKKFAEIASSSSSSSSPSLFSSLFEQVVDFRKKDYPIAMAPIILHDSLFLIGGIKLKEGTFDDTVVYNTYRPTADKWCHINQEIFPVPQDDDDVANLEINAPFLRRMKTPKAVPLSLNFSNKTYVLSVTGGFHEFLSCVHKSPHIDTTSFECFDHGSKQWEQLTLPPISAHAVRAHFSVRNKLFLFLPYGLGFMYYDLKTAVWNRRMEPYSKMFYPGTTHAAEQDNYVIAFTPVINGIVAFLLKEVNGKDELVHEYHLNEINKGPEWSSAQASVFKLGNGKMCSILIGGVGRLTMKESIRITIFKFKPTVPPTVMVTADYTFHGATEECPFDPFHVCNIFLM